MRLKDKIAIVTASAGAGIGQAVARRFAEEGAIVALTDVHERRCREIAEAMANDFGRPFPYFAFDVKDDAQCKNVVAEVAKQYGHVDILVNNAGTNKIMPLWEMPAEVWHLVLDTCLTGTFQMIRAVLPFMMKQRSGAIVSLSSEAGFKGSKGESHYSAAKAAIMGLTRAVAAEAAEYGIRANAVAPGVIMNEFLSRIYPEGFFDEVRKTIPLARYGEPREVADLILFLASDESSYITGQVVTIGGGHYMHA